MLYLSTFSVVGRDPDSSAFGIAVASAIVSVGWLSRYAAPDAGVIAIQAWSNPYVGLDGVKLLRRGLNAEQVLEQTLAGDSDADRRKRQVAIIDQQGGMAAYTGPDCQDWKGHLVSEHCIAAGNLLVDDGSQVLAAMVDGFLTPPADAPLAERLLQGLEAGQRRGGDRRGRISASLFVVQDHDYPLVDVRVDDHVDPVPELRRVYEAFKQFHHTRPELFGPPRIRRVVER